MEQSVYKKEYLPYIIKWGKITSWISIPLVCIPALAVFLVYGGVPQWDAIVTALVGLVSTFGIWYVVDPMTLYPILQTPGMYLTYVSGQSKEVRSPAAICAMSAAGVEQGTEEASVVSAVGISVSVFISVLVMTVVAVGGNFILSILPAAVTTALNYLMPALFGSMWMQQIMNDVKSAAFIVPAAIVIHLLNTLGVFASFPLGGGYMQILLCAVVGVFTARFVHNAKFTKKKEEA